MGTTVSTPSRRAILAILRRLFACSGVSVAARAEASTSALTRSGARRSSASAAYPPMEAPTATNSPTPAASRRRSTAAAYPSRVAFNGSGSSGDSPQPHMSGRRQRKSPERAATW
jgi:hypothetical protein